MENVKNSRTGKDFERTMGILRCRGYICHEMLGNGAFSEVYRIEDGGGSMYACKISNNIRLLEKEAQIMKELEHPLFPKYFNLLIEEQWGFLVMEYIPGSSLENILERRGGFSARQTVRMGMELAEGLSYLHERRKKYLFQDVKPANIVVRQDGRIKLLDFGCVYSIGEKRSIKAGTPGYAAPEQLDGQERLTEACDVYGLGKTLEAMLSGVYREVSGDGKGSHIQYLRKLKRKKKQGRREAGLEGSFRAAYEKCCGKTGGRKKTYGKRYKKELRLILEACTRQEASVRISNMRDVIAALAGIGGAADRGWRREASCRKNIWESMYKKA